MVPRDDERPNVIGLQVAGKYEEGRAEAAIKPGHALKITDTQTNTQQLPVAVAVTSSAGAEAPLRIADVCLLGNPDETAIQGMKITDAYAEGDIVPFFTPLPGDIFSARVATNANFGIDDILKVSTDGTFVAHGGSGRAACQVLEAVDFGTAVDANGDPLEPLLRVQAL